MKSLFTYLLLLLIACPLLGQGEADWVWLDETGKGRNQYAYFRYELELDEMPSQALIHLYASARYHLKVNGAMLGFGPLRSFPQHPVYDSYDLVTYLQPGKNVIAVKVMNNGMQTYQLPDEPAAFIAWGEVVQEGQNQSLATPGAWKAIRSEAYDAQSVKFSFACGPQELYDERKDIKDWDQPDLNTDDWQSPVAMADQTHWSEFSARPFPALTQQEQLPTALLGMYAIDSSEVLYHFHSKVPDENRSFYNKQYPHFAYTYLYSPRKQQVSMGSYWGNFILNGKPVGERTETTDKNNYVRYQRVLALERGWNYLFIAQSPLWGAWDFFMALPRSAAIEVSAFKDHNRLGSFQVAGPFLPTEEAQVKALKLPFEPNELPESLSATWQEKPSLPLIANPSRAMAWLEFGEKMEVPAYQVADIEIPANEHRALVFDLGQKTLGRVLLDVEAPAGTVFDLGFSEDLRGGKPTHHKRVMISAASRFISAGGESHFEQFKPYGMRYVQVNVLGHTAPVKIKRIAAISQVYPFDKQGSFECSDPVMNALWEMGWRTLQVCSEDTYTDTPFRERGLYAGDMLPEYAITLATSGDHRLLKYSLQVFQDIFADRFSPEITEPRWYMGRPYDFAFITLQNLAWYLRQTQDWEFAEAVFPAYQHLIDWAFAQREAETGLLYAERVFIEWTKMEKSQYASTAYNALVEGGCRELAKIAKQLGKDQEAEALAQQAEELNNLIQTHLWDEQKGAFRDGIKAGEKLDSYYPISSIYPYLFSQVSDEQGEKINQHLARELADIGQAHRDKRSTPYGGFYVLSLLYQRGDAALAEQYIRKYWSPMVFKHNDTTWENFPSEGSTSEQGTLSHAWSGHITYFLSSQVLGMQMGWQQEAYRSDHIVFAPQSESLNWARGTIPHQNGTVKVDWELRGKQLFFNAEVPEGLTWEVKPRGRLADYRLWVNGKQQ